LTGRRRQSSDQQTMRGGEEDMSVTDKIAEEAAAL